MKTLHESILDKRNKKDTSAGHAVQIAEYLNQCSYKARGSMPRRGAQPEDWAAGEDVITSGNTCTLKSKVNISTWHGQPQYTTFIGLLKKLKINKLIIDDPGASWLWEKELEDFEIESHGSLSFGGDKPKFSNCKFTICDNLRFNANYNDIQDCKIDAFITVISMDYGVVSRGNKFTRCTPEYKFTSTSDCSKAVMKFRRLHKKGEEPHIRDIINGISVGKTPIMIEYSRSGSTTNSFYIYVSTDEKEIDQVTNWQYQKVYSDGYWTAWGLQKGASMRDPFA